MIYDFDTPVDRSNTNSLKWNVKENELPMWVADMDFKAAPEILDAIQARAAHGVFGYTEIPDAWYEAYIGWWESRHGFRMEKDWLIFCTGIVPAISSMVRKLTTPAEKVLVQTPVYNIFFNSIMNNGRQVLESPLVYDGETYHMDFADLEEKLADPQTSLMILCNPQNPAGNLWDRGTLARIGDLCKKYHVTVISDEIHCDLTSPGYEYIPFASVSDTCREISVTCLAPTKTFNLAGLQTAAVSVPDETLRHRVWRGLNTDEVAEPNAFAVNAAVAAFTKGAPWLDELRVYIEENKKTVTEYAAEHMPQLHVVPSKATYLMWLDCGAWVNAAHKNSQHSGSGSADTDGSANAKKESACPEQTDLAEFIREKTGLYVSSGSAYGGNGAQFLRMNVACPHSLVLDGMQRLKKGLAGFGAF
ncbi:MAG: pyridoxal phosphate-dependent aminotransferase [Lachnospiraceae bacterium]|nr:pyridoxal phosphate-dependent aminotransferase [Lachnospiraceae bacterium]